MLPIAMIMGLLFNCIFFLFTVPTPLWKEQNNMYIYRKEEKREGGKKEQRKGRVDKEKPDTQFVQENP